MFPSLIQHLAAHAPFGETCLIAWKWHPISYPVNLPASICDLSAPCAAQSSALKAQENAKHLSYRPHVTCIIAACSSRDNACRPHQVRKNSQDRSFPLNARGSIALEYVTSNNLRLVSRHSPVGFLTNFPAPAHVAAHPHPGNFFLLAAPLHVH